MTKPRVLVACAAALFTLAGGTTRADETTYCNAYITTLPYTITTQGHYCFNRNLSTAITAGAAITISTDFVVLDLNNFKLGGGSAGPATLATGISATNRSNITIRNGNIRGFAIAISLDGATATSFGNNLVENCVIDGNTAVGIQMFGIANTVRNSIVTNTGGSTAPAHPYGECSIGIINGDRAATMSGGALDVLDTTVATVIPKSGGECAWGIYQSGSVGGTVDHCRVTGVTGGIGNSILGNVCRDNTVQAGTVPDYSCEAFVGANYPGAP